MFERYAESAKRVIFFARYEASCTHSETIEPAHILLGLIREHPGLLHCFLSIDAIVEIEADARRLVSGTKEIPTSVELPLSEAGKQVLRQAAEGSSESVVVYPVDLLLGLLLETESGTSQILLRRGLALENVRQKSADLRVDATGAAEWKMPGPLQWDISINRQGHPPRFVSTWRVVWISLAILVALAALVIIGVLLLRR